MLRKTQLVSNGKDMLPDGLIPAAAFATAHSIAITTCMKAINTGRLPATHGEWRHGRTQVTVALDPEQQRRFVSLFERNPGWKPCKACPHQ